MDVESLSPNDIGEYELLTDAGRVVLNVLESEVVVWRLARDTIGVDADVPSAAGDAVDWPVRVGEVPRLRVESLGQLAGETIADPRQIWLPESWAVRSIRKLAQWAEPSELLIDGRVRRCWHEAWHAETDCRCSCSCCSDGSQHLERIDLSMPTRGRLAVVTEFSIYSIVADVVLRVPDGDPARAQVMSGASIVTDKLVLGGRLVLRVGRSMRTSSAIRALVLESTDG